MPRAANPDDETGIADRRQIPVVDTPAPFEMLGPAPFFAPWLNTAGPGMPHGLMPTASETTGPISSPS